MSADGRQSNGKDHLSSFGAWQLGRLVSLVNFGVLRAVWIALGTETTQHFWGRARVFFSVAFAQPQ